MVPVLIPVSHIIRTKNPHVNETRKPVPGPVPILENSDPVLTNQNGQSYPPKWLTTQHWQTLFGH
jgi:hypothetical protein